MKAAFAILSVLALAACAQAPHPDAGTAPASSVSTPAPAPAATTAKTGKQSADVATTLAKYHWQLASATDKSGRHIDALFARADKPLQLDFTARDLSIGNTCNRMHGGYTLADGKLGIDHLASTMMACPDPKLMALDAAVGKYLQGSLAYALESSAHPQLTLATSDGDKLAFDGVPTAETLYGSAGETVFLEIAPQTQPCNHPLMPNAQCLYVRELHYGANGVRAGQSGAWQILGQDIEGYTHQPGVRNVLRVKRYKIANPPTDASSVAYVLDMVVESETPAHP